MVEITTETLTSNILVVVGDENILCEHYLRTQIFSYSPRPVTKKGANARPMGFLSSSTMSVRPIKRVAILVAVQLLKQTFFQESKAFLEFIIRRGIIYTMH